MPPERYGGLIVVGDPPGGIGGVDRSGQCIEQLSKPAFALAQSDLGPSAVNRYNIFVGGRLTKCGDRPIKFTLKKSDRLVHFRGIPPHTTGDWRADYFPPLARTQAAPKSCAACGKFSAV